MCEPLSRKPRGLRFAVPIENRVCFQVNLRDGLRCRVCGRGPAARATYHSGFGYHHLRPRSEGGPDTIDNLVLLCGTCHDAHHRGLAELNFPRQSPPGLVACRACGETFDPAVVTMNCGWYACPHCDERVHLFDHFGFASTDDDR